MPPWPTMSAIAAIGITNGAAHMAAPARAFVAIVAMLAMPRFVSDDLLSGNPISSS